jgi:hypothetical protein
VDLSTPSERSIAALRDEVNAMVGHAVTRQGIYLINSTKRIVWDTVKEAHSGEYGPIGPVFATYKGERERFAHQPVEDQIRPSATKVPYLLYLIGGEISNCKAYDIAPCVILEGYECKVHLIPLFGMEQSHKEAAIENQEWHQICHIGDAR